jgi:hypothetical protein
MPKIIVTKPFRLASERVPARLFAPGEHEISEAELGHWFVKACLREGRAVLAPLPVPMDEPPLEKVEEAEADEDAAEEKQAETPAASAPAESAPAEAEPAPAKKGKKA